MKLLILDLDETLIFATENRLSREPDLEVHEYSVYLRPFVKEFLAFCRANFRVAVWTSSSEAYAAHIVPWLFGPDFPLEFVWARQRCTRKFDPEDMTYEWIKDLGKVKRRGFRLEEVIMVDDTPRKLCRHYGNLVRIKMFEGEATDNELPALAEYLQSLMDHSNVRAVEKRYWRARNAFRLEV